MNIDQAFPSKYLKAADFEVSAKMTMDRVEWETLGTDRKLVLYFQGEGRGLVLNKTNANRIAFKYGKDTDQWSGKPIEVYSEMVDFQGKSVEALRVRPPAKSSNGGFMPNAKQAQQARSEPRPPPPEPESYGAVLDDDVPF